MEVSGWYRYLKPFAVNYEAGRGFSDMTGYFRTYLEDGEFVYFVLMSYNLPSMGAFHVFVVKC